MPTHEEKRCPRCQGPFTCKAGSIELCQCRTVDLNATQRQHLAERFDDCLCANCLLEERKAANINEHEQRIRRITGR